MGNFPYFWGLGRGFRPLIQPDFCAQFVGGASFIDLRESEGLSFKVKLARMKFIIILKVDDIGPNELSAMVLKYINYTFHMYRLYGDA